MLKPTAGAPPVDEGAQHTEPDRLKDIAASEEANCRVDEGLSAPRPKRRLSAPRAANAMTSRSRKTCAAAACARGLTRAALLHQRVTELLAAQPCRGDEARVLDPKPASSLSEAAANPFKHRMKPSTLATR